MRDFLPYLRATSRAEPSHRTGSLVARLARLFANPAKSVVNNINNTCMNTETVNMCMRTTSDAFCSHFGAH